MDRLVVRGLVEDYWRSILPVMQSGDTAYAAQIGQRFEQRINEAAATLPPVEAIAFQQMVEAERERLVAEYQSDPAALKTRLGVGLGVDAPDLRPEIGSGRMGLGELAVRTAVRATVWEGVWAFFRGVR